MPLNCRVWLHVRCHTTTPVLNVAAVQHPDSLVLLAGLLSLLLLLVDASSVVDGLPLRVYVLALLLASSASWLRLSALPMRPMPCKARLLKMAQNH